MVVPNRLFFALLPDAAEVDAVRQASKRLAIKLAHGGKDIVPEHLHLTLMFVGDAVSRSDEAALREIAASVRMAPYDFVLDAAGSFTSVWWLGQRTPAPGLLQLRKALQAGITARKVAHDRGKFVPHVTIARNIKTRLADSAIEPITWHCEAFTLMRSTLSAQGSVYEIVERWPLAAAPPVEAGQMPLL